MLYNNVQILQFKQFWLVIKIQRHNLGKGKQMKSQKSTKFINIKVKTLNHSIFEIFANPTQPIFSIQGQIEQKTQVPVAAQRLLYRGIQLQPMRSFSNYDIGENNIISLIANKLPSQLSQSSSLRRSQIHRIKSLNKQHLQYKKHMLLQQRTAGFKQLSAEQSLQVISQNKHVIDQLLECLNYNYAQESIPFKLEKRKLKVGEWVDVRDLSGQWTEGQVLGIYGEYVKAHYNGWPERMSEWINESSDRIMPFRSHTVQSQSSIYLSPYPKYEPSLSKSQNPSFKQNIQTFVHELSATLENFSKLVKDLELEDKQSANQNQQFMMMIENENQQSELSIKNMSNNAQNAQIFQNNLKDIDQVQLDKKEQFYTPSKQIRANDNLSNKAEDDVVSKCDKDDISNKSNKSFKSKRSQGLVDTQSMKSLIIEQKKRMNKIFFDSTQAQSVKSVKNHKLKYHYMQDQEYIVEQSDSQINDQPQNINNSNNNNSNGENFVSFRKKQYKRKMKASQMAPMADRLGRLLVDLAPHLAMMGYQEQAINNFSENLSTFTNEGSLESKLAKAQLKVVHQHEQANLHNNQNQPEYDLTKNLTSASPYCQFQIPVMLTPSEILRLTKLVQQEKRLNAINS